MCLFYLKFQCQHRFYDFENLHHRKCLRFLNYWCILSVEHLNLLSKWHSLHYGCDPKFDRLVDIIHHINAFNENCFVGIHQSKWRRNFHDYYYWDSLHVQSGYPCEYRHLYTHSHLNLCELLRDDNNHSKLTTRLIKLCCCCKCWLYNL